MPPTVGSILANDGLPEDMRDETRVLDAAGLKKLLNEVATRHPEKYRQISKHLLDLGRDAAQETGGFSFGMGHLRKSVAARGIQNQIRADVQKITDDDRLDDRRRETAVLKAVGRHIEPQQKAVYAEALKAGNPLAYQVLSGAKGKPVNLASLLAGDLMYVDHRGDPVPVPILSSYSEGLKPWEYFAGTFGARKGVLDLKSGTAKAGYFGKLLVQASHRLVVDGLDGPDDPAASRGLPVATDDGDNEGALLARDAGPYKRNTVITPRIQAHLKQLGHDRVLVRSPTVGGPASGGVWARDVGVREHGTLPGRGEFPGVGAAQALSEPVTQATISSKHTGGVAGQGKTISGFGSIESMVQIPKTMHGGAAHAQADGIVTRVTPAPAGGHYVFVNGTEHYVQAGLDPKVRQGDRVEAGDVLSDGLPRPAEVVKHKGIGEGRRYFVHSFRDAMRSAGVTAHRRNVELLGRGLIDHVKLTGEVGDYVPDDVVPYHAIEAAWTPREGTRQTSPGSALGKYLEKPVLHYSIGTKVRPSVQKDLEDFGIKAVHVHDDPPPFEPVMVRGSDLLQHDEDWLTRHYGSGLKGGFLKAVHRGSTSDETGTSFVPSLARGVDFGRVPGGKVRKPEPGWKPQPPAVAKAAAAAPGIPGDGRGVAGARGPAANPPSVKAPPPAPPAGPPPATPPAPAPPASAQSPAAPAPQPAAPPPPPPQHKLWFDDYQPSSAASPLGGALLGLAPSLGPMGLPAVLGGLGWNELGVLTRGGGRPPPGQPPAVAATVPSWAREQYDAVNRPPPARGPDAYGRDDGGNPLGLRPGTVSSARPNVPAGQRPPAAATALPLPPLYSQRTQPPAAGQPPPTSPPPFSPLSPMTPLDVNDPTLAAGGASRSSYNYQPGPARPAAPEPQPAGPESHPLDNAAHAAFGVHFGTNFGFEAARRLAAWRLAAAARGLNPIQARQMQQLPGSVDAVPGLGPAMSAVGKVMPVINEIPVWDEDPETAQQKSYARRGADPFRDPIMMDTFMPKMLAGRTGGPWFQLAANASDIVHDTRAESASGLKQIEDERGYGSSNALPGPWLYDRVRGLMRGLPQHVEQEAGRTEEEGTGIYRPAGARVSANELVEYYAAMKALGRTTPEGAAGWDAAVSAPNDAEYAAGQANANQTAQWRAGELSAAQRAAAPLVGRVPDAQLAAVLREGTRNGDWRDRLNPLLAAHGMPSVAPATPPPPQHEDSPAADEANWSLPG